MVSSAARLNNFYSNWTKITNDSFVLNTIQGYKINLEREVFQDRLPRKIEPNKDLDLALQKLILKEAVEKCKHSQKQFLSFFFLTPKSDGSLRFILNLKKI